MSIDSYFWISTVIGEPNSDDFSAKTAPILFHPNQVSTLIERIEKLGRIALSSEMASELIVEGEGLRICVMNHKTSIHVHAKNQFNHSIRLTDLDLIGELMNHHGKIIAKLTLDFIFPDVHLLSYTANREGIFSLSIKLYGQHIEGSPFQIRCISSELLICDSPSR